VIASPISSTLLCRFHLSISVHPFSLGALSGQLATNDPVQRLARWLDASLRSNKIEQSRVLDIVQFLKKLDSGSGGGGTKGASASKSGAPQTLQSVLTKTLAEFDKLDKHNIFAKPVPEDTPNYHTMIQRPMDLSNMRRTLIAREYATLRELHEDFELMLGKSLDTYIYFISVLFEELNIFFTR
jgi:hypothetical protein